MHDINTLPKLSTTSTTNAQELLRWENNILVYLLHYTLANYFLPGYEPSSPNKPNKPVWCSGNTSMYCSPLSGGGPSTHVVRETLVQIQALAFIFFSFFFFCSFSARFARQHQSAGAFPIHQKRNILNNENGYDILYIITVLAGPDNTESQRIKSAECGSTHLKR